MAFLVSEWFSKVNQICKQKIKLNCIKCKLSQYFLSALVFCMYINKGVLIIMKIGDRKSEKKKVGGNTSISLWNHGKGNKNRIKNW